MISPEINVMALSSVCSIVVDLWCCLECVNCHLINHSSTYTHHFISVRADSKLNASEVPATIISRLKLVTLTIPPHYNLFRTALILCQKWTPHKVRGAFSKPTCAPCMGENWPNHGHFTAKPSSCHAQHHAKCPPPSTFCWCRTCMRVQVT